MNKLIANLKFAGIIVITFCTVFLCTVFLNYSFDLKLIAGQINDPAGMAIYEGKLTMNKIIVGCTGGILGLITLLMLIFTIVSSINENQANMGVLKALGSSNAKIALPFAKYGLSVLAGAGAACLTGYFFAETFYIMLDSAAELPVVAVHFHYEVLLILVVAPAVLFTALSIFCALIKLRKAPLAMLKEANTVRVNGLAKKLQASKKQKPFLKNLKTTMLLNNLLLIFFVGFAALAFSTQIQMAFNMNELTDNVVFIIIFTSMGLIIGGVTLLIALNFVMKTNKKYLAFMQSLGYTAPECNYAIFGGYRIVAYIGFALGTLYQFILTKIIVSVMTASYESTPKIDFNLTAFFVTLAIFVAAYEIIMLLYKQRIKKISLKEVMQG